MCMHLVGYLMGAGQVGFSARPCLGVWQPAQVRGESLLLWSLCHLDDVLDSPTLGCGQP